MFFNWFRSFIIDENMSFLDNINKSKYNLKQSVTKVTQADGKSYIENKQGIKEYMSSCYGFVVDTKPDNVPAMVLEKLYVGSQDCVDVKILQRYDLKYILSIGIPLPEIDLSDLAITLKFIPCLDLPETNLLNICNESNKFIKDALEKENGSVLVHCNAGVSRSVSVVIGFLILEKKYSFEDAYNLVKSVRQCAQPNAGFIRQLQTLY